MPMFAVAATPPSVLSAGVLGDIRITTIAVVGDLPSHRVGFLVASYPGHCLACVVL